MAIKKTVKQLIQKLGLSQLIDRVLITSIQKMMVALTKLESADRTSSTSHRIQELLPAWAHLVDHEGGAQTAALRHWSLELLLSAAPATIEVAKVRALLLAQLPPEVWHLVPALEKRSAPVMSTWTYQNDVMTWDIPPEHLVLDVGSGGWPFKRANHLADRYPDETTHRVEEIVRDQRPFFEADLEHLPFADRAYDFVFCSHVLEHLDHPGQAIRELMRVAPRGYIEVPTRLSDVMFNFTRLPNHHRWHGMILGNTLVLIEWNAWERRDLGNYFFDSLQSDYSNSFQDFFERNRDLFFASYHWSEKINFLIINDQGIVVDSSQDQG